MRVLIDTNILLDYFAKREPYLSASEKIITWCAEGKIDGCVAAHSLTNIFYILRKIFTIDERRALLSDLCEIFEVEAIDVIKIKSALKNKDFDDIEDCLQAECAKAFQADFILTRNIKDFQNALIPCLLPDDFLKIFTD